MPVISTAKLVKGYTNSPVEYTLTLSTSEYKDPNSRWYNQKKWFLCAIETKQAGVNQEDCTFICYFCTGMKALMPAFHSGRKFNGIIFNGKIKIFIPWGCQILFWFLSREIIDIFWTIQAIDLIYSNQCYRYYYYYKYEVTAK